ncbi:MAG: hypothetical protein LBC61_01085 [Candidatus Peribacteria bacterium]|jgi:hypothetical protein|nr:hypothetical protein [Candidatus Peribacteria bacterium]
MLSGATEGPAGGVLAGVEAGVGVCGGVGAAHHPAGVGVVKPLSTITSSFNIA